MVQHAGLVMMLISQAASKFRKHDGLPPTGEENLIIATFGTSAFLH